MMKKGKKFDKKNCVTFELVNRSQQDPLINYEDAPKAVLVEQSDSRKRKEEQRKFGIYYDDDYDYMQHLKNVKDRDKEYEINEVYDKTTKKFVHFDELNLKSNSNAKQDDDNERRALQLPSSLFESGIKETVGMLNKAALPSGFQPDWDLDIARALDDTYEDFDGPENELDDDFIFQAQEGDIEKVNFEELEEEPIDEEYLRRARSKNTASIEKQPQFLFQQRSQDNKEEDEEEDDDDDSDRCSFNSGGNAERYDDFDERFTFRSHESKSGFTSYSMSSSIMPRNKGLTDLDEQFENFYIKDYADDTEIGDLNMERTPHDEINHQIDRTILNEFVTDRILIDKTDKTEINRDIPKETILRIAELQEAQESEDEEKDEIVLQAGMGKNDFDSRWDCESVISTYSNLYNHPKLICEPTSRKLKINPKTGIPEKPMNSKTMTKALKSLGSFSLLQNQNDETESIRSTTSVMSQLAIRNEQETAEERRQRKKNLKEYMRERRLEKKVNKEAFKAEHLRQQKESITNRTVGAMKMI